MAQKKSRKKKAPLQRSGLHWNLGGERAVVESGAGHLAERRKRNGLPVVTLGVSNVARSRRFKCEGLPGKAYPPRR